MGEDLSNIRVADLRESAVYSLTRSLIVCSCLARSLVAAGKTVVGVIEVGWFSRVSIKPRHCCGVAQVLKLWPAALRLSTMGE